MVFCTYKVGGKLQSEYRPEESTKKLCYYYERKHKTKRLRPIPVWEAEQDWFEIQLHIAHYLGIHWHDLYRKDTDLDGLFREAAKRG